MVGLSRVWLTAGLVLALTAASVGLASPAGAVAGYGDVPEGTWYTDAVQWSVDNGIAGVAGACFAPDIAVSRGETAVWIYNMENRPDVGDPHSFSDVTDASQDDAVSWMANNEITTGKSPTTFAPDDTLTRAEAATFLHRLASKPSAPPHSFVDVVTGWQQGGVSWMSHTGITTGTSPTTFAPEVTLTRAHLVTFLYRYQGEPDVTINTATPTCDPADDAETVAQYQTGDTIAGFPSGFAAVSGNFSGASVEITGGGGTVTVNITRNGSAAYSDTTYTCASVGGCTIVNGRVTKGTVNATTATVDAVPAPDLVVGSPTARYAFEGSSIVLSWDPVADADYYRIYYHDFFSSSCRVSSGGSASFCEELATDITDTSYTHTDPDDDNNYYWVVACNSSGCSPVDSNNPATIVGAPPTPDLVVGIPTIVNTNPTAGTRFMLSAVVRNLGERRSAFTTLRYYQSVDATITTADTAVGRDSVSRLDARETGDESINLTAPSVPGTYYYGACVDSTSDESDTTNNCSVAVTVTVGAAPAPDLVVGIPTIVNTNPTAGTRFMLSATVRNQGNARSAGTTLRYYRSTDRTVTIADIPAGTDYVSGLGAQESETESISVAAPSEPGTYYYGACVESVSDESDTTNNCSVAVTVTVGAAPAPDLVVGIPSVDVSAPPAGTRFMLSATVRNQGNARSAGTTLRYYRSTDATITSADMSEGTDYVSGLGAQESETESISVTAPSTPGTYYYGACVESVSDESDTTNNCSVAVTVTVGAAPAPDLVVGIPSVDVSAPPAGTRFMLSATVRNQGNARSAGTTLRYYRSTDRTVTIADIPAGTDYVSGLGAQESETESISVAAPSEPGTYYYGACVDTASYESDTTNNCSTAVTVTVGAAPAPDLVVGIPSVDVSAPVTRESFTLSATVRNQGNARSAGTTLRFYHSTDAAIATDDTEIGTDYGFWLDAQESETESISMTAPSTPGTYYYGACVDTASNESDTTNNCSTAVTVTVGAAPPPDLVVDAPTVDVNAPVNRDDFVLSATVRNQGNGWSAGTILRYFRSADATITTDDTEVGTDSVSLLAAEEKLTESIRLTASSTSGTYYYGACVDSVSDESDTTNNCSVAVTVTVADAPPSSPAAPTVSSTTVTSVTIVWTTPSNDGPPITDYDVEYRPDVAITWTDWPHTGTERTATIGDLTTDVTYDVRVRAVNPGGASRWSPSVWATAATHDPPPRPTNVRWRQIGTTERVTVSWNQTPKATYYKVYHCSSYSQYFECTVRLIESFITDTEYTHTVSGVFGGITIYVRYAVQACNGTGCSSRVATS